MIPFCSMGVVISERRRSGCRYVVPCGWAETAARKLKTYGWVRVVPNRIYKTVVRRVWAFGVKHCLKMVLYGVSGWGSIQKRFRMGIHFLHTKLNACLPRSFIAKRDPWQESIKIRSRIYEFVFLYILFLFLYELASGAGHPIKLDLYGLGSCCFIQTLALDFDFCVCMAICFWIRMGAEGGAQGVHLPGSELEGLCAARVA